MTMTGFKGRLRAVLGVGDTPHRIAFAFSVGIFIAFSPLLGLHVVLAILLIGFFRLNKPAVLAGTFVNNPWTLVPILVTSTWVGEQVCCQTSDLPNIDWSSLTFATLHVQLRSYIWPFVLGSLLLGLTCAILSYFLVYWLVSEYRRVRPHDGVTRGVAQPTGDLHEP